MVISALFGKRVVLTCSTAAAVMLAVTAGATSPKSQLRIRAAEVHRRRKCLGLQQQS